MFIIGVDGFLCEVEVVKLSGFFELDVVVVVFVCQWCFCVLCFDGGVIMVIISVLVCFYFDLLVLQLWMWYIEQLQCECYVVVVVQIVSQCYVVVVFGDQLYYVQVQVQMWCVVGCGFVVQVYQ